MQNAGNQGAAPTTATLGKIAKGGAQAAPTVVDAPTKLSPVSVATIERLTGVKLR